MRWLIDEKSVVLNEILVAIQKSVHFCEHAINWLEDKRHKRFFRQQLSELNILLSDLADFIHMKGGLPREPDSEKEAFEQWKIDLKALLSENEEASFLNHYMELQKNLLACVEAARIRKAMPEGAAGLLNKLDRHIKGALDSLKGEIDTIR